MLHAYTHIERLAATDVSLLVLGETGTGKELAASALHFWSRRKDRAPDRNQLRGGARQPGRERALWLRAGRLLGRRGGQGRPAGERPRRYGVPGRGGDLSLTIQGKLLRALESRRITRLGSVQERAIDVRLVAATHRDLEAEVRAGRFRQDLYYRLNVGVVCLAPLRERPRELPLLARRFLAEACDRHGRPPLSLTEPALAGLRSRSWPGNVRELKNVMEYLAATVVGHAVEADAVAQRLGLSAGQTAVGAPVVSTAPPPEGGPALKPLAEASSHLERQAIEAAVRAAGGNKTRAAKLLFIHLRTFMTKIKRHGL